jgi:hypothetical protein
MSTGVMPRRFRRGTRTTLVAFAGIVVGLVLIILAVTGAFSSSSALGNVGLVTTSVAPQTPNAQMDPFGAPKASPDYVVPPAPG